MFTLQYCWLNWAIFSHIRPALLAVCWPVQAKQSCVYTGKYSPIYQDNNRIIFFGIDNVCIITGVGLESGYTVKYSLSPWEIPQTPPSGFPSCSGYISPYIPPISIIQKQYISVQMIHVFQELFNEVDIESDHIVYTIDVITYLKVINGNITDLKVIDKQSNNLNYCIFSA